MPSDSNDYLLERRLQQLNPSLHQRFKDTVFVMQRSLSKFQRLFPEYTDHSVFHSLNVLAFCNVLIGPAQLQQMNESELYVLLMGCYLHDTGMSISQKDYEQFKDALGAAEYFAGAEDASVADFVRDKHQEFSACYINKYADMLEIPSDEALFAITQVARGHRRTDLYDEEAYPADLRMQNGDIVHLPYLASLIRLADEIDVIADRNPKLLYDIESLTDAVQVVYHKVLAAVPRMDIEEKMFLLHVDTDDQMISIVIEKMVEKMQSTLDYCRDVTARRTP